MSKEIEFIGYNSPTPVEEHVVPSVRSHPDWYKNLEKKAYGPRGMEMPTVKTCNPFFDALSVGYTLITPCDIEFYLDKDRPKVRVLDDRFPDFVGERDALGPTQFTQVIGHHAPHFHWYPLWAPKVPEGYSILYTQPLNRYELPFLTTNGIIENDSFSTPGNMPFFLNRGFVGVLPKGTPYSQLIPFKRESWKHTENNLDEATAAEKKTKAADLYRAGPEVYRKTKWSVKHYK